jgi:hypothetical protein
VSTEYPHPLDGTVWDAEARFRTAPPGLELHRARKVVEARFRRGDYVMLQALDDATRDRMAQALVDGRAS